MQKGSKGGKGYLQAGVVCCALSLSLFSVAVGALSQSGSESELRAAVIVGILRFANQQDHDLPEYRLCLAGNPPSSDALLKGQGLAMTKNRSLRVLLFGTPGVSAASCAAIVIGPSLAKMQYAVLAKQSISTSNILLFDDCRDDDVAHATLRRKGDRIVFSIDLALARQAQISFSAQLLKLASDIRQ